MSNGFSAADMSTAAANGFRDGLAAQPGAAQEADMVLIPAGSLSEMVRELAGRIGVAKTLSDHEEHLMTLIVDAYERVEAAPVAAAPVDRDAHGLRALDNCIADLRRLLELSKDYDLDVMQMQSLETAIESMELRKVATTPAAPVEMSPQFTDMARAAISWVLWHHLGGSSPVGQPLRFALGMGDHDPLPEWRIAEAKRYAELAGATTADFHKGRASTPAAPGTDLEQFRAFLRQTLEYIEDWAETDTEDGNIDRLGDEAERLLALIDASSKGGSDAWQPMDVAPKSVADGERVEGIYLLGYIPDADLVDPQACIDVIWWEPLLPNSQGGRGKWCANRYGEACEVAPTGWQHLPSAPATSAEVGA